jgi:leucyl aminopeptidase
MKMDMGGAAMMFGAACAIASLKLPVKITVYTPLAHNAISSSAYNVSDIIKTRSGTTVEVLNTDAEGRIILSDALTLAGEEKADYILDAATLTGAAVVALGEDIAAVYGTDRSMLDNFFKAAKLAGEQMWPMPLHSSYKKMLKSHVADIKNTGDRWAGSIVAALFLQKFVKSQIPWIHVDIAGPGCKQGTLGHLRRGAKGFGVKSVVAFARLISTLKN